MFTDIVGYSALAQENEDLSIELLEEHRDLLRPLFPRFGGREIETIGDAFFLEFGSVQEAVHCGIEIQKTLNNRNASEPKGRKILVRVGIHVGDIVHVGEKVHGDGVNIAARIQPLAKPGGIAITDQVYAYLRTKKKLEVISQGLQRLKNIESPVEVFDVVLPWEKEAKTASAPPRKQGKRKILWPVVGGAFFILAALAIIFDQPEVVIEKSEPVSPPPPELPSYDSIAVLPFDNLSDDRENAYFTRGIHEDILTSLSKVKALKVISRTSVMQYENKAHNLREIGEALGVGTILEGSVRRSGLRVRISAQLIDARTDKHLWADNYDGDLTDIFELQSTIAEEIVTALKATLTPEEKESIERIITENTEAYDFYLKARDYHFRSRGNKDEAIQAERLYERAIKLDSTFALAYAQLSVLHSEFYWFVWDHTKERLQKSKDAVDRALQLQPDLPEGQTALAWYYYHGFQDYYRAQEILFKVLDKMPNNAEAHEILSYTQRRQGKWQESIANLQKATELDPHNVGYLASLANTYQLMRDFPTALNLLEKALKLAPESLMLAAEKGDLLIGWKGDTSYLKEVLAELPDNFDPGFMVTRMRVRMLLHERDYKGVLGLGVSFPQQVLEQQDGIFHIEFFKGMLYNKLGDLEKSGVALALAVAYLEPALAEHKNDPRYHAALGKVYGLIGRKEDAIREGFEAVDLMPMGKDALLGYSYVKKLAEIYADVGEPEKALDKLEYLLSIPGHLTLGELRWGWEWDKIRDHPRFQALIEEE